MFAIVLEELTRNLHFFIKFGDGMSKFGARFGGDFWRSNILQCYLNKWKFGLLYRKVYVCRS